MPECAPLGDCYSYGRLGQRAGGSPRNEAEKWGEMGYLGHAIIL